MRSSRGVTGLLAKASFAIGTPESLPGIVARLAHDRAFHRDLTAHIWVLIDRNNERISYADMLGVLALAAAGTRFAVAAASAAHVQGEVKVQADVDRDGIVTSACVIAGPRCCAMRRWIRCGAGVTVPTCPPADRSR